MYRGVKTGGVKSKCGNNTQNLLYLNLLILIKLDESSVSSKLKEFVTPGIFSKPNRAAFEIVMYFLINAYDPDLCRSTITCWPIVERKTQERVYRRDMAIAVAKIASEEADFGLPNFSNSFMSAPGGDRLETFLCRFSCLALRNALQRLGAQHIFNPPRGLRPRRCLSIVESREKSQLENLVKKIHRFTWILKCCSEESRSLGTRLISCQFDRKMARRDCAELGINESKSLESIFNEEIESKQKERFEKLLISLKVVQDLEKLVLKCRNAARLLLDEHRTSAALSWDSEEPLDLADFLSRTADAVEKLSSRLGPSTDREVLPQLQVLGWELDDLSQRMSKMMDAATQLATWSDISNSLKNAESSSASGDAGTPERFRHVCQMLEDATLETPPFVFHPATSNSMWQTISADIESPPMSSVADFLGAQKAAGVGVKVADLSSQRRQLLQVPQQACHNASKMTNSTPTRPARALRSGIPLRTVVSNSNESASKKSVASRLLTRNPTYYSTTTVSTGAPLPLLPCDAGASKIRNENDSALDTPMTDCVQERVEENSAQNVLNLAASVLSPLPGGKTSLLEETQLSKVVKSPAVQNNSTSLKFSDSMEDSPFKTELAKEPEKKAPERRKSLLDVIARYRSFVALSNKENVPETVEQTECNVSDINISLDGDLDISFDEEANVPFNINLSIEFK